MKLIQALVRRVKCDETKPSCYLCISTGRKCDGYGSGVAAPPELSSALSGVLQRSLSIVFLGSEKERRSFYFFRQKTLPQLSKFFGGDFWEMLLLQMALHEYSIRYALLALGSLHAKLEHENNFIMQSHTGGNIDHFALKNYGRAINVLVEPLLQKGQQAIDVCLICSILFACFETIQSSYGSAITHVQSGMKILSEIKYNEETRRHEHDVLVSSRIPYVSIDILEKIFVRLDFQVIRMISGQKWETYNSKTIDAPESEIPAIFSSLSKARDSLVSRWHVATHFTSNVWDPTSEKLPPDPQTGDWQKKSISILARWSSAYDVYLNIQGGNLTDKRRQGTAALSILKELGYTAMMLTQTMVNDQRDWDIFGPMFQNVVSLAEDIVQLDLRSTIEGPSFCIDMAIVGPLFKISCRCRDPIVRRRAISILRTCSRTEGVWDSFSASVVAQRVLDIEEGELQDVRSCEDVPGWARISCVSPVFHLTERRVTLTYRWPDNKHNLTKQLIEEVIEW